MSELSPDLGFLSSNLVSVSVLKQLGRRERRGSCFFLGMPFFGAETLELQQNLQGTSFPTGCSLGSGVGLSLEAKACRGHCWSGPCFGVLDNGGERTQRGCSHCGAAPTSLGENWVRHSFFLASWSLSPSPIMTPLLHSRQDAERLTRFLAFDLSATGNVWANVTLFFLILRGKDPTSSGVSLGATLGILGCSAYWVSLSQSVRKWSRAYAPFKGTSG